MRARLAAMALLAGLGLATPVRAELAGLVIGIDAYRHINPLQGAVNDARDIADALRGSGSKSVTLLIDAQATRDAIMAAWDRLLATTKPDDVLILSYAGHGGQEPERAKGSEEDGLDEVILLAGFAEKGPGTYERIVDDDIAVMLQRAAPRRVIFVSDACHSGTMTRSFDRRAASLGTRFATYGAIEDDALPPPNREAARADRAEQPHVTFLAAVAEHELAPEVAIDGKPRGALSWAFAQALRGKADRDGDGTLSKGELEIFVQETVRMKAAGRQHPQVYPAGQRGLALLSAGGTGAAPATAVAGIEFPPARPLALAVSGGDARSVAGRLKGVQAASAAEARLVWDPSTGDVVTGQGDVVASVPGSPTDPATLDRLQRVVDKWSLIDRLEAAAAKRPLIFTLKPGDRAYRQGDEFTLEIGGHLRPYFTLFNLGSDGTVNFLYPLNNAQIRDSLEIPMDRAQSLTLRVDPPFGADHFVAVSSAQPLTELHRELAALDGQPAAARAADALDRALRGKAAELGWHGVYSVAR